MEHTYKTLAKASWQLTCGSALHPKYFEIRFKIKHHVKMKECGGASSLASRSTSKLPQGKEGAIVWVKMWPRDSPAEEWKSSSKNSEDLTSKQHDEGKTDAPNGPVNDVPLKSLVHGGWEVRTKINLLVEHARRDRFLCSHAMRRVLIYYRRNRVAKNS